MQQFRRHVNRPPAGSVSRNVNDSEANKVGARQTGGHLAAMDMPVRIGSRFTVVLANHKVVRAILETHGQIERDLARAILPVTGPKLKSAVRRAVNADNLHGKTR